MKGRDRVVTWAREKTWEGIGLRWEAQVGGE